MPSFEFKHVVLRNEGVKATLYRRGDRRFVAFGSVPWTLPVPPKPEEVASAVVEATFGEGAEAPVPVGERDLTIKKIGRRKRRIYRVAAIDLEAGGCWLSQVGWYVDTLNPPGSWISNDPFGPYATRDACIADAWLGYRGEEE